jgi:hypothetical protein
VGFRCSVRWGRVGVSKIGPREIVGVFERCVDDAGTRVPPELRVRRRFWEAWITLRIGDVGWSVFSEALRLWMKSVRADISGRLMGEDIWRPPRDDGGVGPPNSSSPRLFLFCWLRRRLKKMMARTRSAPMAIPGRMPTRTAAVGNLLGACVGLLLDCPLEMPGISVDEEVEVDVAEELCSVNVDIELLEAVFVGFVDIKLAVARSVRFVVSFLVHENPELWSTVH